MDNLFTLVKNYEAYLAEGNSENLGLFGEWLKQRHSEPTVYESKEARVNAVGPAIICSYLLGSMSAYIEMWARLALNDEPIAGMMDWSILKKVEEYKNPSKKMIITEAIAERTSCVEAMKRLVRKGILYEETDPEDKRIKRVFLTEEGKALIERLNVKMANLGKLIIGTLSDTEAKAIIPPLKRLIGFHENLDKTKEKKDIKKIYGV